MPLQIEIKDEHLKEMIEFYVSKQRDIRMQINNLEKQAKEVSAIIQQLNQSIRETGHIRPLPESAVYSDKWPWVKKIKFAIGQGREPVTTREIVDLLIQYEPALEYNRKKAVASVSSTLSVKTGEEFGRVLSESGDNAYYILEDVSDEQKKDPGRTTIDLENLPF